MSLIIDNIQQSFETKQVLADLSFTVEDGEFVSIIGPSGSGKSTLFSIIGGLLKPTSGEITLDGHSIVNERGHISYMPQQDTLLPWRTILQNVVLGQELQNKTDERLAETLLVKAGLQDVVHAYPHQLSGGMKQRASFIRALLSPQKLLLLDEPFSALDEFTRVDMQKWLLSIWEEHRPSILLITHSIEEALLLSDKIVIFSSSPANVKEVINVPFPRPRDEEILMSEGFLQWKKRVIELL